MKTLLTVFVALISTLAIAAPANAGHAPNVRNGELTVQEIKALKVDAKQLQNARIAATRDGVVTRVERARIDNLEQDIARASFVYTHNRRSR